MHNVKEEIEKILKGGVFVTVQQKGDKNSFATVWDSVALDKAVEALSSYISEREEDIQISNLVPLAYEVVNRAYMRDGGDTLKVFKEVLWEMRNERLRKNN